MSKQYISANQLLEDAWQLGLAVHSSGFQPDLLLGVWRGGTPVAIAVHELLDYLGCHSGHGAVRTTLYTGIDARSDQVEIAGLDHLLEGLEPGARVLIVDDVLDTGLSLKRLLEEMHRLVDASGMDVRVATTYFKPENNQTDIVPDFYVHETADWLVFPHELDGLSAEEILADKPGVESLRALLSKNQKPGI